MTSSSIDAFALQASLARLLGNATRLRLLHILHREGTAVPLAELLKELRIGKTCLSGHISKLVGAGLIELTQRGRYRFALLLRPEVIEAARHLRLAIERQAEERREIFDEPTRRIEPSLRRLDA